MSLKFVDEPPASRPGRKSWTNVVAALRENPGKWAEVASFPLADAGERTPAAAFCGPRNALGRYPGVRVAGRTLRDEGRYALYATYSPEGS